jgi:hypothetical protein
LDILPADAILFKAFMTICAAGLFWPASVGWCAKKAQRFQPGFKFFRGGTLDFLAGSRCHSFLSRKKKKEEK